MKIHKKEGGKERKVLIGMITSGAVIARLAPKWHDKCFAGKLGNIIGRWCVDYYKKYDKAPGKAIEGLFEVWAEKFHDDAMVRTVEKFLGSLSGEYKRLGRELNPEYVIDIAGALFNEVALDRTLQEAQAFKDIGELDKAATRLQKYNRVEIGVGGGIDLLLNKAEVYSTFDPGTREVLIKYPGALGQFFGDSLSRGKFISFVGPDKSAKSYWLQDMAWNAMLQKRRVAFFAVGDMTKNEMKERLLERAAMHPTLSPTGKWPCQIRIPTSVEKPDTPLEIAKVKFKKRTYDHALNAEISWKACRAIMKEQLHTKNSYFKLSCHPNFSINMPGIMEIIRLWEAIEWMPDVLVIDYADLLTPHTNGHMVDSRDQIDITWRQLRNSSQVLNALTLTATQSDAKAYDPKQRWLTQSNFSNDKRKNAHVSGMIGLNQTDMERREQLWRLNWVNRRRGAFSNNTGVYVAGCLSIARPAIVSTF